MKKTRKNCAFGKTLSRSLLLLSAGMAALTSYTHIVEKRSLRSWLLEKLFWLSGTKKATEERPLDQFEELLRGIESITDQPFDKPDRLVDSEVQESWVKGMQVFTWNDHHDLEQKVILYIYGSAYVNPPAPHHFWAVDAIAQQTDAKIVFPIHPKVPRHTYRDVYPKILELYKEILASVSSSQNVTLMGDSSGGGFALGLAQLLKQEYLAQPKDIVLFSPWVDAATDNPDISQYESVDPIMSPWGLHQIGIIWADGEDNLDNPLVSPLYGDFEGLGKISLFVGTHEILYPDIMELDATLTELGIPHNLHVQENMVHDYVFHPIPEAAKAQQMVAAIVMDAKK